MTCFASIQNPYDTQAVRTNLQCVLESKPPSRKELQRTISGGISLTYLPNELAQKCANLIVMLLTIRNGFEIMAEMLSLCKEPKTKTQVMYGANLSWRMLQKYLSKLQSKGLMEVHHSPIRYVTTRKGLRFVEKWRELVELL